ncbi:MAG: Smr/MutS family protein [Brevinematales bacterium]|nr:Smr/MutS family protein [Brevinematales bacterium]
MGRREVVEEMFLQAMREVRYVPSKEKEVSSGQNSPKPTTLVVDFHGFSVEKALHTLERLLESSEKEKRGMRIIVGQGHHSVSLSSPLRHAIEQALTEKGIAYTYEKGVIII